MYQDLDKKLCCSGCRGVEKEKKKKKKKEEGKIKP